MFLISWFTWWCNMGALHLWISPCCQLSSQFCTEDDCKAESVVLLLLLLGWADPDILSLNCIKRWNEIFRCLSWLPTILPCVRVCLFIYSTILSLDLSAVKSVKLRLCVLKVDSQGNWYLKMFSGSVAWPDTDSLGAGLKMPYHVVETVQ